MSQTGKIEANGLITALTQLYKNKDSSSKVNDESFKTAFDEANQNGEGVSVDKLLEQLKSDTGISIDDFSQDEKNAINKTLEALSDGDDKMFDDYNDLVDISQSYYDNLESSKVLENLDYSVSKTDDKVVVNKTEKENTTSESASEQKRVYKDGSYTKLITVDGKYKVELFTKSGTSVLVRDLVDDDYEAFGITNPNAANDTVTGGSSEDGKAGESAAAGENVANDNPLNAGLDEGSTTSAAQTASQETKTRIADLKSRVIDANSNEGIFGKIGGGIKNLFDTKYSAKNINKKIAELEKKGDAATEEEWNEVLELVSTYEKKSGGAAKKAGNVAAVGAGLAAGAAAGTKIGAVCGSIAGPVGTLVGGAAGFVVGGVVGFFAGGAAKAGIGMLDNMTNDKTGDGFEEVSEDFQSGGKIGAAAGGAIGSSKAVAAQKIIAGGGQLPEKVPFWKKIMNKFKKNKGNPAPATTPTPSPSVTPAPSVAPTVANSATTAQGASTAQSAAGNASNAAQNAGSAAQGSAASTSLNASNYSKLNSVYQKSIIDIGKKLENAGMSLADATGKLSAADQAILSELQAAKFNFVPILEKYGKDTVMNLLRTLDKMSPI